MSEVYVRRCNPVISDGMVDILQSVVDFIANRPHEVTRSEIPNAGNVVELVYEVTVFGNIRIIDCSRCPPVFENVQRVRQAECRGPPSLCHLNEIYWVSFQWGINGNLAQNSLNLTPNFS